MGKMRQSSKKLSSNAMDVYEASDQNAEEKRILAHRGGGGGAVGRTFDSVAGFDFSVNEVVDEDEDIDEDEAFNESDEERYGHFFGDDKKKSQSEADLLSEGDDDGSDDDLEDEEEEGMVDLSDLIQNEGPLPSNSSSIKDLLPTSFIGEDSDMETFNAEFDVEESDDEFHNSDGSDTMSGVQDDAQELEVDQSENLVTFIQSLDKKTKKRKHREEVTEAFEESEFALPSRLVHKKASNKLELQDMLNPVTESTSFGTLKKQMRDLEHSKDSLKAEESLAAPLPKRIQDRIHRQAAYEETSKDVSKWTPMIKKNREADHLSFPLNQEPVRNMSNGAMVGQFEVRNADFMQLMEMSNPRQASTDMEKEIQALLREAALTEKKLHESEELEFKKISKEELLERQTELGKMRALLFFKEQKQKKIAKIKSKVYRKLHKKAKESSDLDLEELKRLDPELAKQKLEELEAERARERVTLKHKNTGKWAKQMLNRKDGDIETRCAISTQLEKHQQLKKKITGIDSDASDNEAVDEDGMIQLDRLEKELDVEPEPTTGLMGMKFMKRAMDKEKSESKSLIRSTRSLLEGDDYLESDVEGDQVIAVNPGRKTITTEDSMENMSSDDEGDMSFVHDGPLSVKSTGPIVVQNSKYTAPLFPVESFGIQEQQPESVPVNANLHARTSEKQAITKDDSETGEAVNPWLNNDDSSVAVERSLKSQNLKHSRGQEKSMNKFKKSKKGLLEEGHVEDDDETTLIQDNLFTPAQANTEEPTPSFVTADTLLSSSDDDSDLDISKPKTDMINVADITKMSQADIMRLTFENDDVAEEFDEEKRRIIDQDKPKEEDLTLPGWGSWGGTGLKAPKKRIVKTVPGVEEETRQDSKMKHVIINEKRPKRSLQYMVPNVPHGFENRDQYERVIRMPIGKEWNAQGVFRERIKPKVQTKLGTVIDPLKFVALTKNKKKPARSSKKL